MITKIYIGLKRNFSLHLKLNKKPEEVAVFGEGENGDTVEYWFFDHFAPDETKIICNILNATGPYIYIDSGEAQILSYKITVLIKSSPILPLPLPDWNVTKKPKLIDVDGDPKQIAWCYPGKNPPEIHLTSGYYALPPYCRDFILFHELGHMLYEDEQNADHYAFNRMVQKGYGLKQIQHAIDRCLIPHPENQNRIKAIIDKSLISDSKR